MMLIIENLKIDIISLKVKVVWSRVQLPGRPRHLKNIKHVTEAVVEIIAALLAKVKVIALRK